MKKIGLVLVVMAVMLSMIVSLIAGEMKQRTYATDGIPFKELEAPQLEIVGYDVDRHRGEAKILLTFPYDFKLANVYNTPNYTKVVVHLREHKPGLLTRRYLLDASKANFVVEDEDGNLLGKYGEKK